MLRDERDENVLFCGGDKGLYKCDDYKGIWKPMDKGLPKNVTVTDIKLNYCQDKLYWTLDSPDLINPKGMIETQVAFISFTGS